MMWENDLVTIQPEDFAVSPFRLIGQDWLMLAAEKDGVSNGMTCSWGGLGVLWRKNVAFIFVRHSRYTLEFMEGAETFSLSFFDDPEHKLLHYFGTVSGRTEDKIAQSGLTCVSRRGAPCFREAKLTLICKKLYAQDQQPELFLDPTILESCYSDRDYHRMYVGEILSMERQP